MTQFTIDWPDQSGRTYRYWSEQFTATFKDKRGNYMFVKPANGGYLPVYIGRAESLRDRLSNHERAAEARLAGATLIMAHTTPAGEQGSADEERNLIAKWQPPLNVQHKKVS